MLSNNDNNCANPDLDPQSVIAFGGSLVTGPEGMELDAHHHRKAQLIYMARGALTCQVPEGLWIVPPKAAIWIPGGVRHGIKGFGAVDLYSLFVEPDSVPALSDTCCTVSVSPLLRELILRCARLPTLHPANGEELRLVSVLLDELATVHEEDLHFPIPSDNRLRMIADEITDNPSSRVTLPEWARRLGVSGYTLSRLVFQETGMSFGRWRQRLQIILALQLLSQGASVQSVATDLGYESTSSFVTMFRKTLGTSPARYMAERHGESADDA